MLRKRNLVGAGSVLGPPAFHQQRAAKSYEALLAAAASVFASHGFEGAQTPLIAAEAGVATGTFYRYFKDKRQAFLAVMASRLQLLLDETRPGPSSLRARIRAARSITSSTTASTWCAAMRRSTA